MTDTFDLGDAAQIYSGSSLNTFMRCGKQWEYAYVYAYKRPPHLRMVIGTAAHEAVAINYQYKLDEGEDLDIEDVLDSFSDAFDRLAVDVEPDEDEKESPEAGKDSGITTVRRYQEQVAPKVLPMLVEHEVQFTVDGIPYAGTIDLVDSQARVRDLKTVKRRPQDGNSDYILNMTGYALGYRHLTGGKESEIVLDYMVRTKDPYYWPVVSDGPVTDDAIGAFAGILRMVNEAIKTGIFLPTGLTNHACSWCGYQDVCDAYRRVRLK